MLKIAEKNIPNKWSHVLMILEGHLKKNKAKNFKGMPKFGMTNGKMVSQAQHAKKKEKLAKEDACF